YYRSLLADACRCIGRVDDGLAIIVDALKEARRTGERWWTPELHRTQGALVRLAGDAPEAERCYSRAIAVARQQRAKPLELRATVSLAEWRLEQRKSRPAGRALRAIYDWFTEGFDTPDLKDARTLLDIPTRSRTRSRSDQ